MGFTYLSAAGLMGNRQIQVKGVSLGHGIWVKISKKGMAKDQEGRVLQRARDMPTEKPKNSHNKLQIKNFKQ